MTSTGPGYGAPAPRRRPVWVTGAIVIVCFVALLYVIEFVDTLMAHQLDQNGIRPLEADGLTGILFAPLLHADFTHLTANTVPALVLGFLMTLAGLGRFIAATAIVWIVGGFGTWLIGDLGVPAGASYNHIGASGLIFGWLAFLVVFGFFTRTVWEIVTGIVVLVVYGGILLGVLPGTPGVSWQGHLCGAMAGLLAAYVLSAPERHTRARARRPSVGPSPYS